MHAGRRDVEPRVPDAAPRGLGSVFPALTETLGNPATAAIGPDEPSLTSLSTAPAVPPATVASYAVEGDQGVSRLEEIIRNRANRLETGKFSKYDSYYLPQTPIPFGLWSYRCRTCRFYNAREKVNARGATCNVVGQDGDPLGGEYVHPEAWCAYWLPQQGRSWFEWATDRLEGTDG
jgi:hypothetical protein